MSLRTLPLPERGFDALVGYESIEHVDVGEMRARIPFRPELTQPLGLLHGGVFAAIAESLASVGTYLAVAEEGKHAMGLANATNFMRPLTRGTIHATARALHRGSTTWIWDVEMRDDDDRLCAVTRMTIAVRDPRG